MSTAPLSYAQLKAEDDNTSNSVIRLLQGDPSFIAFAEAEGESIRVRDEQDGTALASGVEAAKAKGVLPSDLAPPKYEDIDVLGKSGEEVAATILKKIGEATQKGCVVIIVGLSGTGKGTTVAKMREKLSNSTAWSNGNCFRSLTLLAAKFCQTRDGPDAAFDGSVLTPENLGAWCDMLEFGKFDGNYDIRICGNGVDSKVSAIANTLLKEPIVAKNIPTVAKETQGEVVKFAGSAVNKMGADGVVVLLEGREQTLDFIASPYRFRLVLSEPKLIGQRRAAQRIVGAAMQALKDDADEGAVEAALKTALATLVKA